MTKKIIPLTFLFFSFFIYAEDLIVLPPVTTFFDSIVTKHKIILDKEEIEEMHAASLCELLESCGIQILSYGSYGLESKPSIRGFTDETVRVVLNGICVNNAQYGTYDFTSINIEDIEQIEIVKGGFTEEVCDEGAIGGVIYITTKNQSLGQNFSADSSIKTFFNKKMPTDTFSQSLGFSGQLGNNSFIKTSGKITYAANKYFYEDHKKQLITQENSRVIDGNGDFQFTQYLKHGSSVTISDLFYGGNKNTPGSKTNFNYGNQQDYNNKLSFSVLNPSVAKLFRLENTIAWLKDVRFYSDKTQNSTHYIDTFKYFGQMDFFEWEAQNGQKISQAAGLTADFVNLNSTNDGIHKQFSGTFSETTKIVFNDHFKISVPMSFKFCGQNFAYTPKFNFTFSYHNFAFLLDFYRMVQFPNMDDLYWVGSMEHGNPDLKPENGYGGELTFVSNNNFLPFSFNVFTNYYEQKIQWSDISGKWQPENISSAFYLGVDFDFKQNFLNNQIYLNGNVEYLYTRLLKSVSDNVLGNRIMYTPDFTGSLTLGYKPQNWNLNLNVSYMGKRYKSNINAGYLKPYLLVNFSVDFKGWNYLTPYLKIDNLLNCKYEAVPDYPMPGISLTLGCHLKK